MGLLSEGSFLSQFFKNFPWPPLCTFLENAGFGRRLKNCHNLAFRALLELFLRQNLLQSLHFKCILIGGQCNLRQRALRPFKRGLLSGRFLKNFSLVPPLHFFRKCGFWVTLRKLPYLGYSGTFGAAFYAKMFSSLCTLTAV